MTKQNTIFFLNLLLLASFVATDQIIAVTAPSCCSTCSNITNSTIYPTKLRNQIFSSIDSNQPTGANIVRLFNMLPYDYFKQFTKSMFNFNKMVSTGIASCLVDVSGTDEFSYSEYSIQTFRLYFDIAETVVWIYTKKMGQSPNFINTYKNLMNNIKESIYQIQNGEYVLPSCDFASKCASQHALGAVGSLLTSLQGTAYNNTLNLINNPSEFCDTNIANYGCVQYLSDNTNIKLSRPLNIFNIPTSDATLSKTTFFSKIMNTPQVNLYPFILDKVRDGEPSIFTSGYMSFFNMINFTGDIYVPPGVNLSSLPNNGFGLGETTNTVWAKIMASMFGPYLHCKYPSMLNTLMQGSSCYASCSSTC